MKKMNVKPLIISALSAVAFGAVGVGTTFALFTDKAETSISVQAGKINLSLASGGLKLYSAKADTEGTLVDENGAKYVYEDRTSSFTNGGTASLEGNALTVQKMTPGDKVTFTQTLTDISNVNYKYRFVYQGDKVNTTDGDGYLTLIGNLDIKLNFYKDDTLVESKSFNGLRKSATDWVLNSTTAIAWNKIETEILMPIKTGNVAQDTSAKIQFGLEAVQGNAVTVNDIEDEYVVTTVADLIAKAAVPHSTVYVDFAKADENYLGETGGDGIKLVLADGVSVIGVKNADNSIKQHMTVRGGKTAGGFYPRIEATGEDCKIMNMYVDGIFGTTGFERYPQAGIYVNGNKVTIENCKFAPTTSYKFVNGTVKNLIVKNSEIRNFDNFCYGYLPQVDGLLGYYTEFANGGGLVTVDDSIINLGAGGTYGFHADGYGEFKVSNSDVDISWSSYGNHATGTFTDCTIRAGVNYAKSRSYVSATFIRCEIEERIRFDTGEGVETTAIHVFKDCTHGTNAITQDYINATDNFENNVNYTVNGVSFIKEAI